VSEVVIRPARASDLPFLGAIEDSGAETFAAFGQPLADGSPPAPADQWADALGAGLLWIADDADEGPIGFLAGERVETGLYIAEVDVLRARQKQGHGRRLMQAALDWAKSQGVVSVTLTTFRTIPFNGPFYASLGFRELGDAEMPAHLADTLAKERAAGFEDRCGMRLAL